MSDRNNMNNDFETHKAATKVSSVTRNVNVNILDKLTGSSYFWKTSTTFYNNMKKRTEDWLVVSTGLNIIESGVSLVSEPVIRAGKC